MDQVGGPLGVTAIAVVAALVVCLAVLHFRFHVFRRRKGRGRGKSDLTNQSRVEVLETTIIDAERRLVLIRCDRIEHLIMIGGPADLVVENDVRKVRGPGAPANVPGMEPEKRAPAVPRSTPPAAASLDTGIAPTSKATEPTRATQRPAADARQAPTARSLPAVQPAPGRASARSGETPASTPSTRTDDAGRTAQRPQSVDPQFGRRDATPARRTTQTQHSPAPASRTAQPSSDRNARPARASGRAEPAGGLPAAQIPWSDPDSIENEIVRALRFDPQTRGGDQAAGRREVPSAKAMVDSATTLGDLADKLEEALAREVQSASQSRRPDIDLNEFGFDNEAGNSESERTKPPAQKDRQDKRERTEPARTAMGPAPEAEPRREPPAPAERREEAPVISLNSRRRETSDQLEDEMARLLGELTSDTKGR